MRLYKMTNPNLMKQLIADTLHKLKGGAKSVTISTEALMQLPSPKPADQPTVIITTTAHHKMKTLIENCNQEIAWHGTVKRLPNKTFSITDILVYPQHTTSATVESNDEYYPKWLDSLDDDIFNSIRMQGHSHVNMGVTPSATDLEFYETLTEHIKDYYIFIIMNKKGKVWINLYDIKNNVVYETKDINLDKPTLFFDTWYEEQYALHVTDKPSKVFKSSTSTAEQQYIRVLDNDVLIEDFIRNRGYR